MVTALTWQIWGFFKDCPVPRSLRSSGLRPQRFAPVPGASRSRKLGYRRILSSLFGPARGVHEGLMFLWSSCQVRVSEGLPIYCRIGLGLLCSIIQSNAGVLLCGRKWALESPTIRYHHQKSWPTSVWTELTITGFAHAFKFYFNWTRYTAQAFPLTRHPTTF